MIKVLQTKTMGRGIFATQDIPKDTSIHVAEFIKVLDKEVNNCPTFAKYVFTYTKKYSILCLGVGSLFNHADKPNVGAWITKLQGREVMEFFTDRDIKAGEQLFISYGGKEYAFYHLLKPDNNAKSKR